MNTQEDVATLIRAVHVLLNDPDINNPCNRRPPLIALRNAMRQIPAELSGVRVGDMAVGTRYGLVPQDTAAFVVVAQSPQVTNYARLGDIGSIHPDAIRFPAANQ